MTSQGRKWNGPQFNLAVALHYESSNCTGFQLIAVHLAFLTVQLERCPLSAVTSMHNGMPHLSFSR